MDEPQSMDDKMRRVDERASLFGYCIAVVFVLGIVTLLVLVIGCSVFSKPAPEFPGRPDMVRRALVVGLTRVNPAAYGGWNGDCPGCDKDADFFAAKCVANGVATFGLRNEKATRATVISTATSLAKNMKAGDLLVLYIAGHGGQKRDPHGDEADGQDETLCLWDGELVDDQIAGLLCGIPAGVRVWMVTDTCNSGTNYRMRPKRVAQERMLRAFQGQLIHYGAAADGTASVGGSKGGVFTLALRDSWVSGMSYKGWFRATESRVSGQRPVYEEWGNVSAEFRNGRAFR